MSPIRPLCGPFRAFSRLSAPLTPPSASQMVLPPPVKFQRESAVLDTLSGDALAGSKNSRTEALQRATQRKPAVPSRHEKPLMGIKTSKNFVTANAVDNILSVPNKPLKEKPMTKKAGYGKAPAYLSKVKQQVAEEQEYLREFEAQYEQDYDQGYQSRAFQLSEDERAELLAGMKANWEKLNKAYQTLSFTLDTPAKRVKKEKYEEEMHQLEADIQRLSKPVVLVQE